MEGTGRPENSPEHALTTNFTILRITRFLNIHWRVMRLPLHCETDLLCPNHLLIKPDSVLTSQWSSQARSPATLALQIVIG